MLETLVYTSAATADRLTDEDLDEILEISRENNARAGITGLLLFAEGNFIQVLEGPAEEVERAFRRIAKDPRHRQIIELYREPIKKRSFADWNMGYRDTRPGDVPLGLFSLTPENLETFREDGGVEEIFLLLQSFYKAAYRYEAV